MFFDYGITEIEYLKSKDSKLSIIIEKIGHVNRLVDTDLYSAVVHQIIGQQISSKAQQTIWQRIADKYGTIKPELIANSSVEEIRAWGMTYRKAENIFDFSRKIVAGEFNLDEVKLMSDTEAIAKLASLNGIGVWTAEMILLFCLQRKDILSYDDLAIHRGMRMVYHHRKIDRKLFEKYRKRFSPYCSVASLYFWEVAGGAIPDMKDFATNKKT